MKDAVQHKSRKSRLSAKDLTNLANQKIAGTICQYYHDAPYGFDNTGWYLQYPDARPIQFIGKNWVEAEAFIICYLYLPTITEKPTEERKDET